MPEEFGRFQPEKQRSLGQPVPSRLRFFHVDGMSPAAFSALLAADGFSAVTSLEAAVERLKTDDLVADFPSQPREGLSMMIDKDHATTIIFRPCDATWVRRDGSSLEIVELHHPSGSPARSTLLALCPDAHHSSTWSRDERGWVVGRLTGPSPNGRLLTMPAVQDACRECYSDEVRQAARLDASSDQQIQRALKQGLWLEHFVAEICLQFTPDVWAGQMADLFELDVLAIVDGQRLLFECKDSSFGQNDFLVALKKAHDIEASFLVLVSTRPFHPNVIRAIDRELDRAYEHGDSIVIPVWPLDAHTTRAIAAELNGFIKEMRERTVFHWLRQHFMSVASDTFYGSATVVPEQPER